MEELINAFNELNINEKKIINDVIENNNDINFIIQSLKNIKLDNNEINKKLSITIELIIKYYNILTTKKRCVYFNNIKTPYFIY